ncbi:MAG TPA: ABC transporter ATP-binding protein, partial [bacterium]|nr:ABC transporter ATP-binding protein [bacterium]
ADTQSIFPFGEFLHYTDRRNTVSEQQLRDELRSAGFDDVEVMRTEPTIEDSFMALMEQHEIR